MLWRRQLLLLLLRSPARGGIRDNKGAEPIWGCREPAGPSGGEGPQARAAPREGGRPRRQGLGPARFELLRELPAARQLRRGRPNGRTHGLEGGGAAAAAGAKLPPQLGAQWLADLEAQGRSCWPGVGCCRAGRGGGRQRRPCRQLRPPAALGRRQAGGGLGGGCPLSLGAPSPLLVRALPPSSVGGRRRRCRGRGRHRRGRHCRCRCRPPPPPALPAPAPSALEVLVYLDLQHCAQKHQGGALTGRMRRRVSLQNPSGTRAGEGRGNLERGPSWRGVPEGGSKKAWGSEQRILFVWAPTSWSRAGPARPGRGCQAGKSGRVSELRHGAGRQGKTLPSSWPSPPLRFPPLRFPPLRSAPLPSPPLPSPPLYTCAPHNPRRTLQQLLAYPGVVVGVGGLAKRDPEQLLQRGGQAAGGQAGGWEPAAGPQAIMPDCMHSLALPARCTGTRRGARCAHPGAGQQLASSRPPHST